MTGKVKNFQWTGITREGNRISGKLQAVDISKAQLELKNRGIEIINLTEEKQLLNISLFSRRIRTKEMLFFTRYLSALISAGIQILQALDIISKEQENNSLRSLVISIREDIAAGKTLTEAFKQHPRYFNDLYVSLINVGETSGTLDKTLKRLADLQENSERLKTKIKKALIYPAIVVTVATAVVLILLLFVVPQFETIFKSAGAQLPTFTRIVINVSQFLRDYSIYTIMFIVGFIFFVRTAIKQNEVFAEKIDHFKLRIWIFGNIIKKGILARFTSTLSTTLEAGLPIVDSMKIMTNVMNNLTYKKAISQLVDNLQSGHTLADSMAETEMFPNMVIQMVLVGESSGSLSNMLNHVNRYYSEEVNDIVDNLSNIIEPLIIIVLGIIIGSFVVAMYLPIFKLGSVY